MRRLAWLLPGVLVLGACTDDAEKMRRDAPTSSVSPSPEQSAPERPPDGSAGDRD